MLAFTHQVYSLSVAGHIGATGLDGAHGSSGTTGSTGAWGPDGSQGSTGSTGDVGAQGVTGARGAMGPTGIQYTGATGGTGASGFQGATGHTGATGSDSTLTGPTGSNGSAGFRGSTGTPGPQTHSFADVSAQAVRTNTVSWIADEIQIAGDVSSLLWTLGTDVSFGVNVASFYFQNFSSGWISRWEVGSRSVGCQAAIISASPITIVFDQPHTSSPSLFVSVDLSNTLWPVVVSVTATQFQYILWGKGANDAIASTASFRTDPHIIRWIAVS